ncbi:hypothetical protein I4U23_005052 [Adineta vaga]|nr:hypothetical protein I4U23_005052 [Adineta vaga]
MSNSTDYLVQDFDTIIFWISQIILVLQIIFGTFGNIFNIIIFTRRTLRDNPCSMYFLSASIINLLEIYIVILFYYFSISWNWMPANTNIVWCIISNFLTYPIIALVLWFIVLCSFDRFLTSSRNANTRRISSLLLARKMILSTTLFFFLLFGHLSIVLRPITIENKTYCTVLSDSYIIFYNILFVTIGNVLPIILMTIFGFLTILNVRKTRNNVAPQGNIIRNERMRSKDHQFIRMVLFQVLITVIISIPFCCVSMYNTFARVLVRQELSSTGTAIINFTADFLAMFYFTNSLIGFYIYTLTGHKFRVEFKRCIKYGLNIILSENCLMRCLSLKIERTLFNNPFRNTYRRGNNVCPIQQQQPMIITTPV